MKITVLIENKHNCEKALPGEHGLSIYIEYKGKKILLDAGATCLLYTSGERGRAFHGAKIRIEAKPYYGRQRPWYNVCMSRHYTAFFAYEAVCAPAQFTIKRS